MRPPLPWRRKPKRKVLMHADQGSPFTSMGWAAFRRAHHPEHAMIRPGNCQQVKPVRSSGANDPGIIGRRRTPSLKACSGTAARAEQRLPVGGGRSMHRYAVHGRQA